MMDIVFHESYPNQVIFVGSMYIHAHPYHPYVSLLHMYTYIHILSNSSKMNIQSTWVIYPYIYPYIYPSYIHHKYPVEHPMPSKSEYCISTFISHSFLIRYPQNNSPKPSISISMFICAYPCVSQFYIFKVINVISNMDIQSSIHVYPYISYIMLHVYISRNSTLSTTIPH